MAAFAFEVHLADAPGEAEADEAAVVAPSVVFGVVGVGGDGVRVGRLEEVVDLEVEREVAVEEVGAEAEVDVEIRFITTQQFYLLTEELAVNEHIHFAPQFCIHIESHNVAPNFVLHPFAGTHLHTVPDFSAVDIEPDVHKLARSPSEVHFGTAHAHVACIDGGVHLHNSSEERTIGHIADVVDIASAKVKVAFNPDGTPVGVVSPTRLGFMGVV